MNIVLWVIQIILAAVFLTAGLMKLVFPKKKLEKAFEWVKDFSQNKIQIIAAFEIIGAFGLFLPGVYPISQVIIPLSAAGLFIIMLLATLIHYKRNDKIEMIINIVLLALLAFVIISRFTM